MYDHQRSLATVLAVIALGCACNKQPAPAAPAPAPTAPAASAPPPSAAPPTSALPGESSTPAPAATAATGAVTGARPAATSPAKTPATGVPSASPAEKKAPPAPAREPAASATANAPASAPPAPATKAAPAEASAVAEPATPKTAHAAVGTAKCKMCHKVQFESWSASAHAAKGLDCEGCHGNGADYAKGNVMRDRAASIAAGMILPDVASCRKCHPAADASLLPRAHAHKPG